LMHHGYARERAAPAGGDHEIRGAGFLQGLVLEHRDEGVEPGVETLDALQENLGQLLAGDLAGLQVPRHLGYRLGMQHVRIPGRPRSYRRSPTFCYSTTFGTRYRPASAWGALLW